MHRSLRETPDSESTISARPEKPAARHNCTRVMFGDQDTTDCPSSGARGAAPPPAPAGKTFGGFSPGVVKFLKDLAWEVRNKLSHQQYDLTTWSARSWLSYQTQQLSVKLHIACAWEIAEELGLAPATAVADPRGP